jgi:DNA adenine methylase
MRGDGPLRYPGAKSNLALLVAEFMENRHLVGLPVTEPFAGSAAVSRYLLKRRIVPSAHLWELDLGAFSFWKAALERNSELRRRVRDAKVDLHEFDRCSALLGGLSAPPEDPIEAGYAFLFLNRTSYSGIVGAGPIGGRNQSSDYSIDCRFNKLRLLDQIGSISYISDKMTISYGDGITAIDNSDDEFLYVDPPYFTNGKKFYKKYFSTFDHFRLRRSLSNIHGRWLLSYDYDRKVQYLYRNFPCETIQLYHSARRSGDKHEILVSPLGFASSRAIQSEVSAAVAGG